MKCPHQWEVKRKQPYTDAGIKRLGCIRCGKQAISQWQICADGNNYRPMCESCDITLNDIVLKFMGHPYATKLAHQYVLVRHDARMH